MSIVNSLFLMSVVALDMAKQGLPKNIGISRSSSKSSMKNSTGKIICLTLTNTSSRILLGRTKNQSANCKVTVIFLSSPKTNLLRMDNDVRLILAYMSHRAFSKLTPPISIRMVKLLDPLAWEELF